MKTLRLVSAFVVCSSLAMAAESEPMRERLTEALKEDAKAPVKGETSKSAGKSKTDKKATPKQSTLKADANASGKPGEKVEQLDTLNVEASKLPAVTPTIVESRVEMRKMQEQIDREAARTMPTDTDKALNGEKYSVMGNMSADGRAADAKNRIKELEVKQSVAACIADPNAEEENKKLLEMLRDLEYQKKRNN